MSNFEPALNYVLKNEGGLSENPHDLGGTTNFGISLRFLRTLPADSLKLYGIHDDPTEDTIRSLNPDQVKAIYYGEFWKHGAFDKIIPQDTANYIFDMAVNMGIAPAIKCVQRACWAVMKKWDLIPDDGIFGAQTVSMIQQCGYLLMPALRAERGSYYRMIANNNPEQKDFLKGWYERTYR